MQTLKLGQGPGGTEVDIKYIQYAKYAIFLGCLISSAFNLVDALSNGESAESILFYSGILFVFAMLLIIIPGKLIITIVLLLTGTLMMISLPNPLDFSGASSLFILANGLIHNICFKISSYFLLISIVMFKHIIMDMSVTSAVNTIVAYAVVFFIAEMVYNYIRSGNGQQQ